MAMRGSDAVHDPLAARPLLPITSRRQVVTNAIADDISAGRLRPGDRLESERTLAGRLGVSRVTVRSGLRALADEGLIVSVAGSGHFVAPADIGEPPNRLMGFTELARMLGLTPSTRVVSAERRSATYDEAEALRIVPGAPIFDVERLRHLDGLPVVLDRTRLSLGRVPGIAEVDFSTASLFDYLGTIGLPPATSDFEIQAVPAGERHADLFGVDEAHPLLMITETGRTVDREPIYFGVATYLGERYRFRATFDRGSVR